MATKQEPAKTPAKFFKHGYPDAFPAFRELQPTIVTLVENAYFKEDFDRWIDNLLKLPPSSLWTNHDVRIVRREGDKFVCQACANDFTDDAGGLQFSTDEDGNLKWQCANTGETGNSIELAMRFYDHWIQNTERGLREYWQELEPAELEKERQRVCTRMLAEKLWEVRLMKLWELWNRQTKKSSETPKVPRRP